MAGLLVSAAQASSPDEIAVPGGFCLFESYLTPEGNRYRAVRGGEDSSNVARFADFVRRVFAADSVYEGADNSIDTISIRKARLTAESPADAESGDDFGRLYRCWLNEIERLPLSGAVPEPILGSAKLAALQHLNTQKALFTAAFGVEKVL